MSEPFSVIQSCPVMPASRYPCSTYRLISCARINRISSSSSSTYGIYDRLLTEILNPAFPIFSMVASCKLPFGNPNRNFRLLLIFLYRAWYAPLFQLNPRRTPSSPSPGGEGWGEGEPQTSTAFSH